MSEHSTEISVPARPEALLELTRALTAACGHMALAETDCLRLQLLAEELFINTIDHGYGSPTDTPVRLLLRSEAGQLTLHYEDRAPAFNPLLAPSSAGSDTPGGFGLVLVRGMSQAQAYRREDDRNIIEIQFQAP